MVLTHQFSCLVKIRPEEDIVTTFDTSSLATNAQALVHFAYSLCEDHFSRQKISRQQSVLSLFLSFLTVSGILPAMRIKSF